MIRKFYAKNLQSISVPLEDGTTQILAEEMGDQYHTIHELYKHRMALCRALWFEWHHNNDIKLVGRSKKHFDGTMFDGYFVIFALIPSVGQITYHYDLKHWDKFDFLKEFDNSPLWDGHSSLDVIERLMK